MKKTILVVALAMVLVLAFASTALATSGKFYNYNSDYYSWGSYSGSGIVPGSVITTPGGTFTVSGSPVAANFLYNIGANGSNPGVHANYQATTAKCGICHSVHRAKADGAKLLNTSDASCAGCHTGTTTVTNKIVTWTPVATAAGPHNDDFQTLIDDGLLTLADWNAMTPAEQAAFMATAPVGCNTRKCHATNPHGANSSAYKLWAAKLLYNGGDAENPGPVLDESIEAAVAANPSILSISGGDVLVAGGAPTAGETHALVAGLTCGREGADDCHKQATYAVVRKGFKQDREILYGEPTPVLAKTGHPAGTFAAVPGSASYAPSNGCTGCHDQTDVANGVAGNFTFPHGQTVAIAPNAANMSYTGAAIVTPGIGRARIWMGYGANIDAPLAAVGTGNSTRDKAYDGNCLKCHRDTADAAGIGINH
jgi:predicted CXXCH cytochrome family protein